MSQPADEPALVELFRHNTWATLTLLDACAALDDARLDLGAPGTYGSIRATLLHLVANEVRYLSLLTGDQLDPPLRRGEFPGLPVLRALAAQAGARLAQEAAHVRSGDTFTQEWQGQTTTLKRITVLAQAINHGTEHRTHIATILSQHGITPPEIDAWHYAEAMERA